MKKLVTTITIVLCLLISASAFSQSSPKENHVQDSVQLWNKHLDSVLSHTSLKDFGLWLYKNATGEQQNEGKYSDLLNAYVQREYQVWIQPKTQPKK